MMIEKKSVVSGFAEQSGLTALFFYPGDSGNPNTTSFSVVENKKLRHPRLLARRKTAGSPGCRS
ncbi:MAG: hypothetical protein ACREOI_13880 [bacterium]